MFSVGFVNEDKQVTSTLGMGKSPVLKGKQRCLAALKLLVRRFPTDEVCQINRVEESIERSVSAHFAEESKEVLTVGKFFGALSGLHHGFDQRNPQLAFFELHNAVDGAASRSRDRVLKQCRVIAGFEHHGCRA
jgi:hypothetical protein